MVRPPRDPSLRVSPHTFLALDDGFIGEEGKGRELHVPWNIHKQRRCAPLVTVIQNEAET